MPQWLITISALYDERQYVTPTTLLGNPLKTLIPFLKLSLLQCGRMRVKYLVVVVIDLLFPIPIYKTFKCLEMKTASDASSISYLIEGEGSVQSLSEQRKQDDDDAKTHIKAHVVECKPSDRAYRGSDLPELLATMAITVTEDELRPVIPGDWKKITPDGVMDVLSSLRLVKGFEWTVVAEHLRNTGVVTLGVYDYLRYKMGNMDEDPAIINATRVSLEFHIPPRYILYISTGLILLLAGGAIVGLMAGLWMNKADQREKDQAITLQNIIQLFTENFATTLFDHQGESLQEEAFALVESQLHCTFGGNNSGTKVKSWRLG